MGMRGVKSGEATARQRPLLTATLRLHNLQSKTSEMRRDQADMSTMPQAKRNMWGIQEGFQVEAFRGNNL